MALSAIILPLIGLFHVGPINIIENLSQQDIFSSPNGSGGIIALGFILGTMGIGIGYPGQPHVVNRFMAIDSNENIRNARKIAILWAFIIYPGMVILGWSGRILTEISTH